MRAWKVVSVIIICIFVGLAGDIYVSFNGLPHKRYIIKKQAIQYMKEKYNMDVKAEKSFYNFKFKNYITYVYNINDKEKQLIMVETNKVYNEEKKVRVERLEDNYAVVYYEKDLVNTIKNAYPKFFNLSDIEKYKINIAEYTNPMEIGVSSTYDKNGIRIPSMVKDGLINLDINLKSNNFTDEFLNELLSYIKTLDNSKPKVSLFITCKPDMSIAEKSEKGKDGKGSTRYISLEQNEYSNLKTIDDLRKEIGNF